MKTQRKRISSYLKHGSPTKPIRYKSVCEQKVFCYPDVRSYLKATYPKSLPICSYNYFSIRNSLSDVLYAPLFVAAVSFFVARVEFQVGVLPPGVFRCQIFPCEDLQSALFIFSLEHFTHYHFWCSFSNRDLSMNELLSIPDGTFEHFGDTYKL